MDKNFLTTVFGEAEGHVYEYIGSIPDDAEPESIEMCIHVTLEFLKEHQDNLHPKRVVQFPFQNNRIAIFSKSEDPIIGQGSGEFVYLTTLVPDQVQPVVEVAASKENWGLNELKDFADKTKLHRDKLMGILWRLKSRSEEHTSELQSH